MEFWTYYRALRRRRWILAGSVLVAFALALAVIRSRGDDYEASATLSIPSEQRALFLFGAPDQAGPDARMALALNLLRSRDLMERVIQRLNPGLRSDDLLRRLRVERDRGSGLIRVTVTGKTPGEVVTLVNTVAETAAAYDQEVQTRASRLAREFVEKQVNTARENLRKGEEVLLAFTQEHEFVLASAKSAQVAALEAEGQHVALSLNEIEAKLSYIRAQMKEQSATRSDQEITDNPIARQLRADLVQLEVALTSELAIHTERYPTVAAIKAKIDAIKDRLSKELGKTVSSERVQHNPVYDALAEDRIRLETEKVAQLAKREALGRALDAVHQELPGLVQIQLEHSRLARNVEGLNREYADLQTRLAQARLREQEEQDLGSLAVVDHARAGRPASLQGKLMKLLLGGVLGLLGGGGLAYFLDYLDNTLKTAENAERLLGVPALVAIPRHNPPVGEAYQWLQAALAGRPGSRRGPHTIAVTSLRPGAGTSTVVANLARAFAGSGWRTLIIDGAFQRPTQHVLLGTAIGKGLVGVLTGAATINDPWARLRTF